ncbi:MAG TPA: hypothetical protein VGI12_12735 [Vicinamibacterales bacterium]
MAKFTLVTIAMLLSCPAAARADSDGYYCAGRGYVAYETRLGATGPQHVLHVVRISRTSGIGQTQDIPLADFQTHGMRCGDAVIELDAFTVRYLVDVSAPERPRTTTENAVLDPQRTSQVNLANLARAGVIDLEADGPQGEFQLVISRVSRRVAGGIEHYTVTELIRREPRPGGRILASQRLFEGIFLETVDMPAARLSLGDHLGMERVPSARLRLCDTGCPHDEYGATLRPRPPRGPWGIDRGPAPSTGSADA